MKQDVYDVAVIGAGVVGTGVARKLSAYNLSVILLEKESDVSFGVSKANSGIIHGGFHHSSHALKARLEVMGNIMFDRLQKELHFPFKRCGIVVAAFTYEEMNTVEHLYRQGVENQAIGLELCSRDRILALEPKLNSDVVGGLYAPSGGVIEPYRFVFSLLESAQKNGVRLQTNFEVVDAKKNNGEASVTQNSSGADREVYTISSRDGKTITARYVVNAAGLFADEVSRIFKAEEFTITPRKGEEFLLDRNAAGFTGKVVFPVPSQVSKGMLVIPTVEGTCMVGPTAVELENKEDLATSRENFEKIFASARRLVPSISERDIINSFAGLRPTMEGNDFYIDISQKQPRLIQAAGIQSPGLTAAPAIAEYVKDLLKKAGLRLEEKPDYDPFIDDVPRVRNITPYEADELIRENSQYGEIVCRCESISEEEIIAAIRRGHTTLDGIKFYTRAQMGRCQGGFCTYKILKIIQRETGQSINEITKRGGNSFVVPSRIGEYEVKSVRQTDRKEKTG